MAHIVNRALCALLDRRDAQTWTGAEVVTSRSHAIQVLPEQRGHDTMEDDDEEGDGME